MSKEEDWKELEEWQDKQNEIKQKNNVKEFKAKEYRGTEIFTKLISKLLGSVFSIFVIIFIIAVIVSLFYIKSLFGIYASVNVKKQLKNEYRGQKFVVVNDYGKDIEKDNGQFLMSPKNNKNIIFKVEKGSVYMVDDYSENRLKYYIENCKDKSLVSNLNIEQGIKEGYNTDFLKYEVYIDIENYDELESACNKAYNIVKYLEEQDNKMYEEIIIRNKKIDYYNSLNCNGLSSIEKEIYKAKYEYINILKERNNQQELNKINQVEIENIWKPKQLEIILNGTNAKLYNYENAKLYYYTDEQKYKITGIGNVLLKSIDSVEILKINKDLDYVRKIRYKNKIYKVKQEDTSKENKSDTVYVGGTLEEFVEKFEAKINYDFENKRVYLEIF